jgi:hypothetical protein
MTAVTDPLDQEVLLDQIQVGIIHHELQHQDAALPELQRQGVVLIEVVGQLTDLHLPLEVVAQGQVEVQDLHQEEIRKIQEIKYEKVNILSNSYSIYVLISGTKYY